MCNILKPRNVNLDCGSSWHIRKRQGPGRNYGF
jgi:hypothetical protein